MEKNKKIIIGIILIITIVLIIGGVFVVKSIIKNNKKYEIEKIISWNYFNLYKDGKVGVINRNGDIIIKPEYTSIQIPNPTKAVFICSNNEEKVVLNEKAQRIFTEYEEVTDIKLNELAIEIPYEKSVLKYKKDNKYGLINFEGKKVTDATYDSLENLPYKEGELLIEKDGKFGVINMLGKTVIENKYDEIKIDSYYEEENNYRNSGYIVGTNNGSEMSYEYINYKGEQLNKESYQKIERIIDIPNKDEIYLIYEKDSKYGILKNNEEILKKEYDSIEYDKLNNLFVILKDNKYGIADIEGKILISNLYDSINIEGIYIYAQKDGQEIIFDNKGEKKENTEYKSAYWIENSEYKIVINQDNKYGVENSKGEKIIQNKYYYIEYLNNNYFIVSGPNGKNGIVDSQGKQILELKYDIIQKLDNSDLIEAYIDETDMMYLFNNNMKKIEELKSGKVYDGKGFVKLYSYDEAKYYTLEGEEKTNKELLPNNILFANVKNGKWGFVDKQGNTKVAYEYDDVTEFNEYGFAGIKLDGKWGVIDKSGNIIVQPIYTIEQKNTEPKFLGKYYEINYNGDTYYTNEIK